MKKQILLFVSTFVFFVAANSQSKAFYYESISNPSKTTNFVIGFYPSSYTYDASLNDGKGSSTIKMAIINNAEYSYQWNNYHILILLNDGRLICNYLTASETGKYSCKYRVSAKETYFQYTCFHELFSINDIKKVYVLIDNLMELAYNKND